MMKILFVLPETPAIGGGGIATYLKHARTAFEKAGHEVFTFSWVFRDDVLTLNDAISSDRDRVVFLWGRDVWKRFPNGPFNIALSYFLLPHITEFIESIRPDVIETSDYKAPLYGYLAERRAGRLSTLEKIPVIGFNHGLSRLLYSANGVLPEPYQQQELAAERQSLRWCDLVLVPSQGAMRSLVYQAGPIDNSVILSEPYFWPQAELTKFRFAPNFFHLGRVSFAKGLDHDIHFLNVVASIRPIENITFLGTHDWIPFRESSAEDYIRKRIASDLLDRLHVPGPVSQNSFRKIFSRGGCSLNFSNQETFNYACVEMLSYGLFPYVKAGTPMEEFLPNNLRHLAIPANFDLRGLAQVLEQVERDGVKCHAEIVEHVKGLTDPFRFVDEYERALSLKGRIPRTSRAVSRATFGAKDVTVLVATYNNAELILATIASIRAQTVEPARTIILDDGSDDNEARAELQKLGEYPNITVIRSNSNEGLCATRVKLIAAADTPLSLFLDSDDLLESEYVEKGLAALNNSALKPDAALTWRKNFGASDELIIGDVMGDHYHYLRNDYRMTALIRTGVLKDIGFSSSMRNGEADDWIFWLVFARRGYRSVMIGEPLFLYRFAEGSMSWPWSQGQATLTGIEIAKHWCGAIEELPGQAVEDLYGERIWHMMAGPSEDGFGSAGNERVGGETFVGLYRFAVRLEQSRPKLFALLRKVARPVARRAWRR